MTFINDDDYWLPNFRILIDAIKSNHFDFVYGRTKYVGFQNKSLGEQTSSSRFFDFIPLLHSNIVLLTQQATIIRSKFFFKLNGFDESYKLVADSKFWAKLSLEDIKFKYFNFCCAAYTIQEGQLSSDHATQIIEHKRLLKELPSIPSINIKIAKIKFRFANIGIYIKRFLTKRKMLNPFMENKIMPLFSWMMIDLYGYEINNSTYIDLNYIYHSILEYQIN